MDEREAGSRFLFLIEEYRLAGWIGLGKLRAPHSAEVQVDLALARHAIDTLGMLEQKTKGNRSEDEERLLRQALADLRINFADEIKKEESRKAEEKERPAGEGQSARPEDQADGATGEPPAPEGDPKAAVPTGPGEPKGPE
jgi:hypothetical protein